MMVEISDAMEGRVDPMKLEGILHRLEVRAGDEDPDAK
jgi:hypothetical protein